MKKLYAISILLTVILLSACQIANTLQTTLQKELSDDLGIDIQNTLEITKSDTHGGFHGDGMKLTTARFSDDAVLTQISESADWKALPLTETLTALVYGTVTDGTQIGPFLTEENGAAVIPKIQNGYYYFLDRHAQSTNSHDDTDILNRGSLNLSIALYDRDTNTLYYVEFDT